MMQNPLTVKSFSNAVFLQDYNFVFVDYLFSQDILGSLCNSISLNSYPKWKKIPGFLFLAITASINPGVQVPLLYVDSRDSDLNICVYHLGLECSSVVAPFLICIRYQI